MPGTFVINGLGPQHGGFATWVQTTSTGIEVMLVTLWLTDPSM